MEITKSQKRLLILLGLVLLFAIYDIIANKEDYLAVYFGKSSPEQAVAAPEQTSEKSQNKQERDQYLKNWGKNPFKQADHKPQPKPQKKKPVRRKTTLTLRAISYQQKGSVALINDQVLKVGDVISGYRVQKIEPKQVILIKNGNTKVLTL